MGTSPLIPLLVLDMPRGWRNVVSVFSDEQTSQLQNTYIGGETEGHPQAIDILPNITHKVQQKLSTLEKQDYWN